MKKAKAVQSNVLQFPKNEFGYISDNYSTSVLEKS